jgi:cellulose 1,4-beta-cellobiosidase
MTFSRRLSGRRRIAVLGGVGALAAGALLAIPTAAFAAPGCAVTYTANQWTDGTATGGFTTSITLQNTGDPITSWSLQFNLPAGQTFSQGWSANYTPNGTAITATNASFNGTLATGASTNFGFQGRWTGSYSSPTAFTVNGTPCGGTGGGGNTAPTVSLTSPTSGQTIAAGVAVPLAATATDNSAVARVEFLVDGALVGTDTTSPYTFSATGVAAGNHMAAARAVDNGTPALSTTSTSVPFTVAGTVTPAIIATPTTLTLASGASGTANVRLSSAPTGTVNVPLTRTGSNAITSVPTSISFTAANWQAGVTVTFTAAAGTAAATSTFTATAAGFTSATISVTRSATGGGNQRVDNPYVGARVYNNPNWRALANSVTGGSRVSAQPTGVWIDRIAAIAGTSTAFGVRAHLNEALTQAAGQPFVIQFVIYDLPGRDCAALASNGELGPTELGRYQTEYIDPIAAILADPAFASLRIVTIIEIDSLPNLVTNTGGRATATPQCNTMLANNNYVNGVGYALAKLGAIPNVYNYIDAAHHGWIGWDDNFGPTATLLAQAANASGSTPANVAGFITDTANYSALSEPFITVDETTRTSRWIDFNRYNDELTFAQAFRTRLVTAGFQSNIGMLIDTSRNGWGGPNRPTAASTAADLNTRIDASRIDRRIHKGNWCNQSGAGLGERPRAAPAAGIDAYVWIKPPGESDGSSSLIPNNEGKGFDQMCDPAYTGNARNGNSMSGALPNSPISGAWFPAQFTQLMANAFPPL